MNKVLGIARREFVTTVATKGFILGILITPLIIAVMIVVLPILLNDEAPRVEGEVAIIDPTGVIAPALTEYLSLEAVAGRRDDLKEEILDATPESLRALTALGGEQTDEALAQALGELPRLEVVSLPARSDLEAEKEALIEAPTEGDGRLALIVIEPNAVEPAGGTFGSYQLYVREKLDDRIEDEIVGGIRESIVEARILASGLEPAAVERLTSIPRSRSITVTAEGEQETNEMLNILLPAGLMALLLMSVMMSGQNMITNTIEEKSSRVVEVLLSAVSPMELMTGKIFGQMLVGFLVLAIYAGIGMAGLASFAALGLLDPMLLVYLVIFYVIAYCYVASMLGSIGAAVNELREAQALMTPVMLVIMLPSILWLPITRDPNSTFATLTSFLPPINSFVMLLRMTSTAPPPMWQVWLSILIGAAGIYFALRVAAKIFRIGLLMHGKPPNFATLVRWVRES